MAILDDSGQCLSDSSTSCVTLIKYYCYDYYLLHIIHLLFRRGMPLDRCQKNLGLFEASVYAESLIGVRLANSVPF
jgi:hypothetical protein